MLILTWAHVAWARCVKFLELGRTVTSKPQEDFQNDVELIVEEHLQGRVRDFQVITLGEERSFKATWVLPNSVLSKKTLTVSARSSTTCAISWRGSGIYISVNTGCV